MKFLALITVSIALYLAAVMSLFFNKSEVREFPILRARLGTILSHSDVQQSNRKDLAVDLTDKEFHTYCYLPSGSVSYSNKSGEYIIKRVESYKDCQGFYGIAQFREGWWVSEKEKIWWNLEQMAEANITKVAEESTQKSHNSTLE